MNHYQLLGIPEDASTEEIRVAYKRRIKSFHPDVHGGDTYFNELTKHLQEAYETLTDSAKRSRYDRSLGIKNTERTQHQSQSQKTQNPNEVTIQEFYDKITNMFKSVMRVHEKGTLSGNKVALKINETIDSKVLSLLSRKVEDERLTKAALAIIEMLWKIPLENRVENKELILKVKSFKYLIGEISELIEILFLVEGLDEIEEDKEQDTYAEISGYLDKIYADISNLKPNQVIDNKVLADLLNRILVQTDAFNKLSLNEKGLVESKLKKIIAKTTNDFKHEVQLFDKSFEVLFGKNSPQYTRWILEQNSSKHNEKKYNQNTDNESANLEDAQMHNLLLLVAFLIIIIPIFIILIVRC